MSTLVVVKKEGMACMAADGMTCFGSIQQPFDYVVGPEKIFSVGEAFVGVVGYSAHRGVLESLLSKKGQLTEIKDKMALFELFRELHPKLKEEYFLNPKEEDDHPYESSQVDIFLMNAHGIFGLLALREVYEYKKFWAMGSGSRYALGAMYVAYELGLSPTKIAEWGVNAGMEFDDSSGGRICIETVKLQ